MKTYKDIVQLRKRPNGNYNVLRLDLEIDILDDDGILLYVSHVVGFNMPLDRAEKEVKRIEWGLLASGGTTKMISEGDE